MADTTFKEDRTMAKYKSYAYSKSVRIPVTRKEQLTSGTLECATHTLVETRIGPPIFEIR
jgi:hypothetical protein